MAEEGKRKRLGRGLDALFSDSSDEGQGSTSVAPVSPVPVGGATQSTAIENLQPGRYQPRRYFDPRELDDLAASLKTHGVIQPIIVRAAANGKVDYEIIAGERRWRAAQLAQLRDVPILLRELTDSEALEIALVENLQRENLSPLEEADGYRRLMDEFSHTQGALGDLLGKSRSHVANMMRLLSLPNEIKTLVETGKLSAGHGRALLGADDPVALARDVVKKGLNVRQTEKLVKNENNMIESGRGNRAKDSDTVALEHDLAALLGLQVTIDFRNPGGNVVIAYNTVEQLDEILQRLKGDGTFPDRLKGADDPATISGSGVFPESLTGVGPDLELVDDVDDVLAELEAGAAMTEKISNGAS